ncbi:uncharacterized protein MJAP1_002772 [Malassezia japonica]|uniref:S-adenosyl-L-methionine-dependent methyltransferase n=1 Tax=Malassezia japonica TaxID=223818 RepID=A0AAF0F4R6_9BASI|nr:uncharacterized protein MJAP1_002772 [Malassezia japonica]WFD39791.1 hypothetical protein MJAP1_002772 [Malassezia japonica]
MTESYAAVQHQALNERPGAEWLNMGDWRATRQFSDACEEKEGQTTWLQGEEGKRMAENGSSLPSYDTILALDCAYHFPSRPAFFKSAYARLAPGGTLALVDLVSAWPYPNAAQCTPSSLAPPTHAPALWKRAMHRITCALSGTPPGSFIPLDTYAQQLHDAGFEHVDMADISDAVFPGFSTFLKRLGTDAEWRGGRLELRGLRVFGSVVGQWASGGDVGMVRCALITAKKPY